MHLKNLLVHISLLKKEINSLWLTDLRQSFTNQTTTWICLKNSLPIQVLPPPYLKIHVPTNYQIQYSNFWFFSLLWSKLYARGYDLCRFFKSYILTAYATAKKLTLPPYIKKKKGRNHARAKSGKRNPTILNVFPLKLKALPSVKVNV